MAFFQLILKARKLNKARIEYHDEKLKSIEISKGDKKVHYTLSQRIRYTKIIIKKKLKDFLKKITSCPEDSWIHQKSVLLRTDGTFENYVLKSIFGFLGGIFFTYIFFIFFVIQLNFTLTSATIWCSLIGIVSTIGLAFSSRVRCIVFLVMPQFFSKRGRQALMAYAFILAITGPGKNTLHNIGVLSESLACSQEQLKEAVKTIVDLIKQPFYALKDAITNVVKTVRVVIKKIKVALIAIKRLVLSILRVIRSAYEWLASVVNMCNKELGTPFDRCENVFEEAVSDCKEKLGPLFGGVCSISYVVGSVCYIVKPMDFICILVSYVADTIVSVVRKNVSKGIGKEIRLRTGKFLKLFDLMNFATSFFIFILLLRVINYRHKWLTNPRFDNRYLTDYLREIDLRRARLDKETVLPLNPRERNKYIPLSSISLIKVEQIQLVKSAVFLFSTSCKLLFYMAVDYSLYWILSMIRHHGRVKTKVQRPNSVGVHVSGNGFLAELYRSIVRAFSPSSSEQEIDTIPCLPDPIPPDLDRYTKITMLIVLCWIMAVFEPYGLRLRHIVMGSYHPERAKERAVWLYNHILRSRGNFLKFARRQLRRKFGMAGSENTEKVTCRERLMAICPILNKLFPLKQNACLLCGAIEREGQLPHVQCSTPSCKGLFCVQCFADLQNLCTVCKAPIDYGDLSDISEEKDSSEEEMSKIQKKKEDVEEVADVTGEVDEVEGIQITDLEELASSTEYSYSYQDDESQISKDPPQREPYRDIEAQKLRDDVTTQIFNVPTDDDDSFSESPTSCFVVRARRRLRSTFEKIITEFPDADKSSANSHESSSSEKIDDKELIEIKVDDGLSEKLLSAICKETKRKKKKQSRIKKIFAALSKISWFGRKNQSEKATKTYKSRLKGKKDIEKMISSSTSSSSSAMSSSSSSNLDYRDSDALLKSKKKKKRKSSECGEANDEILRKKIYDSCRQNQKKLASTCPAKSDDHDYKYPHEKRFSPKKLPRGLVPVAREIRYFEVDERETCPNKIYNDKDRLNILSDTKSSSDTSRFNETWNIRGDDESRNYGSMRSQDSQEAYETRNKISASSIMTTIEEDSRETSRSRDTQDDSNESSVDSVKYIDVTGSSTDSSFKNQILPRDIKERKDKMISGRKTLEKIVHNSKASKIDEINNHPETREKKNERHRKIVERRLQRRRNDPDYYSSSDNGHCEKKCDGNTTSERKIQERHRSKCQKSPRRSNRCKYCFKRDISCERRKKYSRKERNNDQYPKNSSGSEEESGSLKKPNITDKCIHREQKHMSTRPELIKELKEDDRIKLIREREDERQRHYDILRSIRQKRLPLKEETKICDSCEFRKATKNKRVNTFPYQETEAFKELVKEYRQRTFPEDKIVSRQKPSISPYGRENKEAENLSPLEGRQEWRSVMSRLRKKIGNAFQANKSNLNEDNRGKNLPMDNRGEASKVDQGKSILSLSEDTTDNNETTH